MYCLLLRGGGQISLNQLKQFDHDAMQVHCGAQGAVLVEIYREPGDLLGLGLARWGWLHLSCIITVCLDCLLWTILYLVGNP